MGREIERKFLVGADWQPQGEGVRIAQGYLCAVPERTVRVRVKGADGYLTVKGKNEGICRAEYEYRIPLQEAEELLGLCEGPVLEKTRYREKVAGHLWEVDVFAGENAGLVVAEVELASPEESFVRPHWLGQEVSGDARYYNSNLSRNPYCRWPEKGLST